MKTVVGVLLVASHMTYYEAKVASFGCTSTPPFPICNVFARMHKNSGRPWRKNSSTESVWRSWKELLLKEQLRAAIPLCWGSICRVTHLAMKHPLQISNWSRSTANSSHSWMRCPSLRFTMAFESVDHGNYLNFLIPSPKLPRLVRLHYWHPCGPQWRIASPPLKVFLAPDCGWSLPGFWFACSLSACHCWKFWKASSKSRLMVGFIVAKHSSGSAGEPAFCWSVQTCRVFSSINRSSFARKSGVNSAAVAFAATSTSASIVAVFNMSLPSYYND